MAPLMMSNWRGGVGNWFLKEPDSATDFEIFDYKYYGPISIAGNYKNTWSMLSRRTCEKFMTMYGIAAAEGLVPAEAEEAHDDSGVEGEGGVCIMDFSEAQDSIWLNDIHGAGCPDSFANHMDKRCFWYKQLATLGKVTVLLNFFAFFMNLAGVMMIFMTKMVQTRDIIFTTLCLSNICCWISFFMWMSGTSAAFMTMAKTSTYPYPGIATGGWMYVLGVFWHLAGVVSFGYLKIWQKMGERFKQLNEDQVMGNPGMNNPMGGPMGAPPMGAPPTGAPPTEEETQPLKQASEEETQPLKQEGEAI